MTAPTRSSTALLLAVALGLAAGAQATPLDWLYHDRTLIELAQPAGSATADEALILDDGTAEGDLGIGSTTARQFLWFNHFSLPTAPFEISEIWVQFPAGANVAAGDAIQLAAYYDRDRQPVNGADLLSTWSETVQVADGATFSVYQLQPPLLLEEDGDVLIGVVNRFTESGVSPPTLPAALDTTTSQGRSWIAVWTGDPPDPPTLPANQTYTLVDSFQPGNWMIRAYGSRARIPAVPALGTVGLGLLISLLAIAGAALLAARRL